MVMVMRVNMMMMIGEGFKIPIFKISAFKDIRPPTHFLWERVGTLTGLPGRVNCFSLLLFIRFLK